jgi:hypothetical protein
MDDVPQNAPPSLAMVERTDHGDGSTALVSIGDASAAVAKATGEATEERCAEIGGRLCHGEVFRTSFATYRRLA